MEMTTEEIVREYRDAKNKKAAVVILAERNDCPAQEIIEILKEGGVKNKEMPRNRGKTGARLPMELRAGKGPALHQRMTKEEYEANKKKVTGKQEIALAVCEECGESYDPCEAHICREKNSFPPSAFALPGGAPKQLQAENRGKQARETEEPEKQEEKDGETVDREREDRYDTEDAHGDEEVLEELARQILDRYKKAQERVNALDAERRKAYAVRDALEKIVNALREAAALIAGDAGKNGENGGNV